jgi:cysteine synthase A
MPVTQARTFAPDALRAYELPKVVGLGGRLYGACFWLMKLLPARFILDAALADGRITHRGTVMETTSGTFGLGLAMVCALRGLPLVLVTDPVVDPPFRRQLERLGATVDIVPEPDPVGGYQASRLTRLAELAGHTPDSFIPQQYDNPLNPAAYSYVAELLLESLGPVDYLVGGVGSGGSMCGTASFLRTANPEMKVVAIDTHGSVLFGMPDRPRLLRGLGNSLMPGNVDHSFADEVHWVTAAEAFAATHRLYREHALFMGPTSGATYLVADWLARREPDAVIVAMFPDEGHRYQTTVGDDEWLREKGAVLAEPVTGPVTVTSPAEVHSGWSRMRWGRRRLAEVLGDG